MALAGRYNNSKLDDRQDYPYNSFSQEGGATMIPIETKINSEGQIVIPPAIQQQLGMLPGTAVQLEVVEGVLQLRKKPTPGRGAQLVAALRGKATRALRTDEIMQLTRGDGE